MALNSILARLGRALGASLLLLLVSGVAVVAAVDIGHKDFAAPGTALTGSKPESKLWYNDGSWWASMWSTSPTGFYIYRLDANTETWNRTTTPIDNRSGTRADMLWDGTKLYAASQDWTADGGATGSGTSFETRLYRYSYNGATDMYTLDGGFPASMRTGIQSETLVIEKDSTGMLWATWTLQAGSDNLVYTNHTVGNDTTWSVPAPLPVGGQGVGVTTDLDDISSIIAFTVSGEQRIGVFWSNQLDLKDYFAWHVDGALDGVWTAETAISASIANPQPADDHMDLKTDSSGRVYAMAKTSNGSSNEPIEQLLVRQPAGSWSEHIVSRVVDSPTRAILTIDESAGVLHVFETGPHEGVGSGQSGGDIYEKTSPTSPISFPVGDGTPVIRDSIGMGLNNATSTKQNANQTTGIVVLAFDDDSSFYWHHRDPLATPVAPVASFTGTPTSGTAPLTVTFTNTSTGSPTPTYAWDFGDPASGGSNVSTAANPSHVYNGAGTYTVSLTVANGTGTDTLTRTDYITVSVVVPDSSTYFPITPLRVLDSRASLGLPGVFRANVARDFQVTNGSSIPNDAVAVTGNITVTQQTRAGYIILAPAAGSATSTVNFPVADNRANGVTVPLSGSGSLNAVYKAKPGATSHILFDVTGYFRNVTGGARFHPLDPVRVLDTRVDLGLLGASRANTPRDFQVTNGPSGTIPDAAIAVTGNITVTKQSKAGYLILAPAAGATTSTINFPVGENRANGVTVALSNTGSLNVVYKAKAGATAQILFDVTGYFMPGSSGATYFPITPLRVLDSRASLGLPGVFRANVARDFQVTNGSSIPNDAVAVTGNITVTQQTRAGYIILAPAAGSATSTVNFPVADNRANGVTVPLSGSGSLNAVYKAKPGATSHILFDVTGYFK